MVYVLSMLFLRLWLLGLFLLTVLAVSDYVFRSKHSLKILGKRIGLSLVWPLTLASKEGRQRLFGNFKEIN